MFKRLALFIIILLSFSGHLWAEPGPGPGAPIGGISNTFTGSFFDFNSSVRLKSHLGSELAPGGGTFTGAATGWTLGTGWAYSANTVVKNGDGTGTLSPTTALTITANTIYRVAYTISSMTVSSVTASLGGVTMPVSDDNDAVVFYVGATNTDNLAFTPTNTSRFTIDNISVKKIGTRATDSVTLFEDDGNATAGNGVLFLLDENKTTIRIGSGIGLGDSQSINHQKSGVANYEYGFLGKISSTAGGLFLGGYTDADNNGAVQLYGYQGTSDPTDTNAAVLITGAKKNGTGVQALGSTETVLQILNNTTELFTMKGNGDTYHVTGNVYISDAYFTKATSSLFPDNVSGVTVDSLDVVAGGANRDINLVATGNGQVTISGGMGLGFIPNTAAGGPDFGTNMGGIAYRLPTESMPNNFFIFRGGQYVFEDETATWQVIFTPTGVNIGSEADNVLVPVSKFEVNGNASIGSAYARVSAAPTNGLIVQGDVGIGAPVPLTALDVSHEYIQLGADFSGATPPTGRTRTNNTLKTGAVVMPHYANSEEPVAIVRATTGDTNNIIDFGGGTGAFNVPTIIRFFTGPTNTTVTGTEALRIQSNNIGIGTTSPIYIADVNGGINSRVYYAVEEFDEEVATTQFESGKRASEWITAGTNYAAANVTYMAGPGGTLKALCANADNDSVTSLGILNYNTTNNPVMEVRVKIDTKETAAFYVGFASAAFADVNGAFPNDAFLVGINSDNGHTFGATQIVAASVDNGAAVDYDDMGVAIVSDTYVKIKIDLTDTEQPRVWINDTEIAAGNIGGTVQAGIALAPYFMVQNLAGGAIQRFITLDYFKMWQDR